MKKSLIYVCAACIVCAAVYTGCGSDAKTVKRMQALEEGVSNPTTPEELSAAISKYEKRVADVIVADQQIGIWYKILGTRYLDNQMYAKALDAFRKATEYYPANQNLYYYVGVCAGFMANQALDFNATGSTAQKYNYLKLAEAAYLRALELEPRYARALYGLGVLYVFELDEPAKAIAYLETLLSIETRHTDGMFVLARAYYATYQFDQAAAMYDKIIATTTSPEKKAEAEANKKIVLDAAYAQ
ncbi:tetratricopeptide repeat protein [Treponema brennaborense]|uniref:Tetratricopeptide TPR_1 repeat-containing protein n=1 Tax=Treponema brennaborense (strain DSM 12168 / CIP 105900 / DD5/3) TaxID=906968 RepID=F4LJJ6_TREBD|nr:tetratricopeptide repeat protein [Treponema brennaborense]AEE16391.1 Tetratricopeptide TPR_1 repeat-containing protein [Treponema brennaborense DSM 12168]